MNRWGQAIGLTFPILPEAQNIEFAILIDPMKAVLPERPLLPYDIPAPPGPREAWRTF